MSPFEPVVQGGTVCRKKPLTISTKEKENKIRKHFSSVSKAIQSNWRKAIQSNWRIPLSTSLSPNPPPFQIN
jgi:hypothetical protein